MDYYSKFYTGQKNKADRPANSRERWAGALMEVRSLFLLVVTYGRTYGRTDGHTDGRTDIAVYRVACSRLKTAETEESF